MLSGQNASVEQHQDDDEPKHGLWPEIDYFVKFDDWDNDIDPTLTLILKLIFPVIFS